MEEKTRGGYFYHQEIVGDGEKIKPHVFSLSRGGGFFSFPSLEITARRPPVSQAALESASDGGGGGVTIVVNSFLFRPFFALSRRPLPSFLSAAVLYYTGK